MTPATDVQAFLTARTPLRRGLIMAPPLRVDGERLWSRLMAMAKIGATVNGGCNRAGAQR